MRFGTTTLAAILGLALLACGGGGASGTYDLDTAALEVAMTEKLKGESGGMMPPGAEEKIREMVGAMTITLVLSDDGTFAFNGVMGPEKMDARGTWKVEGDEIITTTTHEDGKKMSKPETNSDGYEDGKITLIGEEIPFPMVLIRKSS